MSRKATFLSSYTRLTGKFDSISQTILNGHLIIEHAIDQMLSDLVKNPNSIIDARLTFYQKVCIARALTKKSDPLWNMILSLNSLRNDFAHKLDSHNRQQKFVELKAQFKKITKGAKFENCWDEEGIHQGLSYTIAICLHLLDIHHKKPIKRNKSKSK